MSIKSKKWFAFYVIFLVLLIGMEMNLMVIAQSDVKQALIVADPGGSGFSLKVAQNIADQLTQKKYNVSLKKANQTKPSDISGKDLLVIGGPTYMAQPSGGVKKFIAGLENNSGLKTLLFQTGGSDAAGLAPLIKLAEAKGLVVIGSCAIINRKEKDAVPSKVAILIEKL